MNLRMNRIKICDFESEKLAKGYVKLGFESGATKLRIIYN